MAGILYGSEAKIVLLMLFFNEKVKYKEKYKITEFLLSTLQYTYGPTQCLLKIRIDRFSSHLK